MLSLIRLHERLSSTYHCPLATLNSNSTIKLIKPPLELPPELWLEIFQFATYVHHEATIIPVDPFAPRRISTNSWYAGHGDRSQSLCFIDIWSFVVPPERTPLSRYFVQVLDVQRSKQVHATTVPEGSWNHHLPLEFLNSIERLYGRTLQGLSWSEHSSLSTIASPKFFAAFQDLRVLDLRNVIGADPVVYEKEPRPIIPLVQHLILSTHAHSLQIATALSLPSLRSLTLGTSVQSPIPNYLIKAFLKVHGVSLVNVDLPSPSVDPVLGLEYTFNTRRDVEHVDPGIFLKDDACPNLLAFTYPITSRRPSVRVHNTLRRIGLRGVRADGLYPDKTTDTKAHLMAITPTRYPNLELVRTVGFLVDADMDGLLKDVFIWWVERFEKLGIDFLDGEGVLWTYAEPEEIQRTEEGS
ncbi:hypothetical protein AX17_004021 [Amanita inopinata Kibby_2008]|nr:hypothetical protein AX17_004021 [Amanita inopinata Kibby_2008]